MERIFEDDFDLDRIADSGQCFRWYKMTQGSYQIISQDKVLWIRKLETEHLFELSCSEEEFDHYWFHYFDLETCYQHIREAVPPSDYSLFVAAQEGIGIRILQQDPWEMVITFLISQRKSIPAIKKAVEMLCQKAGKRLHLPGGMIGYGFPTPRELSQLSLGDLQECGLGYRARYVQNAAHCISSNQLDLKKIGELDDTHMLQELLQFIGVGKKIAHCIMLFGYHRLNAFPQDVWIHRILDTQYPQGFPFETYAPYNGVMQQYLFEYYRRQ